MSQEREPAPALGGGGLGPRVLYVLLVVLPLAVAGVTGDLIRTRHAGSLAEDEARRMAGAGLVLARERSPEAAVRTLEGVVGYEAAVYREGARLRASDPGFGPETLAPGEAPGDVNGRLGAVARSPELAVLAAASSPRTPGPTYPGGRWALAGLVLATLLLGLGALSVRRPPTLLRRIAAAGIPVAVAWTLLVGADTKIRWEAEEASAREVGLAAALARDLGPATPADFLARTSGFRVARMKDGRILQASWEGSGLEVELRGLPRPPMSRTITGYLTTGEERLRYAASRFRGGTVVFLAPAPEPPAPGAALGLLLVGLGVAAAGLAFVFLTHD